MLKIYREFIKNIAGIKVLFNNLKVKYTFTQYDLPIICLFIVYHDNSPYRWYPFVFANFPLIFIQKSQNLKLFL